MQSSPREDSMSNIGRIMGSPSPQSTDRMWECSVKHRHFVPEARISPLLTIVHLNCPLLPRRCPTFPILPVALDIMMNRSRTEMTHPRSETIAEVRGISYRGERIS